MHHKHNMCRPGRTFRSNHEVKDTKLVLHAKYDTQPSSRIIIQSPDTDVLVLCATHFGPIACGELWFKTGVKELGHKLCSALPAFHWRLTITVAS